MNVLLHEDGRTKLTEDPLAVEDQRSGPGARRLRNLKVDLVKSWESWRSARKGHVGTETVNLCSNRKGGKRER